MNFKTGVTGFIYTSHVGRLVRRIALGPYNAYNENNANFDAASNKRSNFDVVQ